MGSVVVVNLLILALVITSLLALSTSLYNIYTAITDYRILVSLGLNGARKALSRTHLRLGFSRALYTTMYLIIGGVGLATKMIPDPAAIAPAIIILLALNISTIFAIINFILEERDRTIILEEDAKTRNAVKQISHD